LGDKETTTNSKLNVKRVDEVVNYIESVLSPIINIYNYDIVVINQNVIDRALSKKFISIINDKHKHRAILIEELNPEIIAAILKYSICLIGMRLHSVIFALREAIPVLAIYKKEYGPKTPGIMNDMELNNYVIDMHRISTNEASQILFDIINTNVELSKMISKILVKRNKDGIELIQRFISN
jgi:polysaccharide pyruvyl transferase WcaK-like protein